jgi:hypothetical protein
MVNLRFQYSAKDGVSEGLANEAAAIERIKSACFFADAWYYWRREVDGTHAVACSGLQTAANLDKGAPEKSAKTCERRDIIARAVIDVIDDEGVSHKVVAGHIASRIEDINCDLKKAGLELLKDKPAALTKMVERIRKRRRGARLGPRP